MNREEAKQMMHRGIPYPDQLRKIDMIFYDFESRICENCIFYDTTLEDSSCRDEDGFMWWVENDIPKDFGCNRWEPK